MQSTVEQLLNPRLSDLLREGPSRFRLKFLYIDGVEVTQAIQYYKAAEHLTDAADRGADNSVQSVMYKPAWVRVYLSSVLFSPVTVRGHLKLQRSTGWLPIFTEVATIAPQWPGTAATHQTNYAVERGTLGATLNFVIRQRKCSAT